MKGKSCMFDWSWRWTLLAAMCLLVRPTIAYAHLVSTGFGPFYDGIMHLVLSPDNLLGVLANASSVWPTTDRAASRCRPP